MIILIFCLISTTLAWDLDCQNCYDGLKPIFEYLQVESVHAVQRKAVISAICPGNDDDHHEDVFCNDYAEQLMKDVCKHVILHPDEAELACETIPGACSREWTKETCVADFQAVFVPFFSDDSVKAQLVEDLNKAYLIELDQPALQLTDESESQWLQDVKTLVWQGGIDAALASMNVTEICQGVYEVLE